MHTFDQKGETIAFFPIRMGPILYDKTRGFLNSPPPPPHPGPEVSPDFRFRDWFWGSGGGQNGTVLEVKNTMHQNVYTTILQIIESNFADT